MPVRSSTMAAVWMAFFLTPAVGLAAVSPTLLPATVTTDSAQLSSPLASARIAYQAAWAQRQAGEYAAAVASAESAMVAIDAALSGDLDLAGRRDLTDLRSRLAGLRDAARTDRDSEKSAQASGNVADEGVLNAPAVDEITPQFNEQVYRYIDFFTGAGRSVFERWLKRSGRYMELFRSVLQKEGLPPDLVHLVFVESGFNLNARSISAAVGPWQFLRGTARLFGLTVDRWVDERRDPEKSTVAAARYLKHLYSIFGDWPLALGAYNAGEGTILRAIKQQGTTNYWDLRLPRQTEDYVPQFMAALAIAHDPEKYGFDSVELDDPMTFDQIAFKGAVDLHTIAKLADCPYQELRELNPALLRGAATGSNGVTTLRVPPGKGQVLMQRLADGGPLPAVNLTLQHHVRAHETLQSIAAQYGVSARELALRNDIGRKSPLRRGMTLTVPANSPAHRPQLMVADDPRASTAYVPTRNIRPLASLEGSSTAEGRELITVKKGQTLASIAAEHGVTVSDIVRWNHLKSPAVRRGTRLKLRTADAKDVTLSAADSASVAQIKVRPARRSKHHRGAAQAGPGLVVVRSGETLSSIAARHGVTVNALKRANGLTSGQIRAGQRLKLPNG